MPVYTVHQPPPRKDEVAAAPERFAFVRDGFYFWAFLFGPFWMLWRRLWLVTLIYVAAVTALETGMWALRLPEAARAVVSFLLALLIGFEAGTLRRWTLARRGWNDAGIVVGDDLEAAERRFFAAWHEQPASPAAPRAGEAPMPKADDGAIIGLFPQPGAPR
ncbi:MAG TPA: DUF2628 domain-containing protein [Xanthobacteraceae bacterium]|nr:DUF2628 domain-containing protein [Xanthobacteraceae bacterium]